MSTAPTFPTGRPDGARPAVGGPVGPRPCRSRRLVGAVRTAVGVLAAVLALGLAGCSDDGGAGGSDSGSGSGSVVEE